MRGNFAAGIQLSVFSDDLYREVYVCQQCGAQSGGRVTSCPACGAAAENPSRPPLSLSRRAVVDELFSSEEKGVLRIAIWAATLGALLAAAAQVFNPF